MFLEYTNCLKAIPFRAAHTYIAHIWQNPPLPPGPMTGLFDRCTLMSSFGVVLMSCKGNFRVVRSVLRILVAEFNMSTCYFCWSGLHTNPPFGIFVCGPLWFMFVLNVFWSRRSSIDPIFCGFCMVLSMFLRLVLANLLSWHLDSCPPEDMWYGHR